MVNEHTDFIIAALQLVRGDDLPRARRAFRNCTIEEMMLEYGESGRTRQEILDVYEEHDARVSAAIAWVRAQ